MSFSPSCSFEPVFYFFQDLLAFILAASLCFGRLSSRVGTERRK